MHQAKCTRLLADAKSGVDGLTGTDGIETAIVTAEVSWKK